MSSSTYCWAVVDCLSRYTVFWLIRNPSRFIKATVSLAESPSAQHSTTLMRRLIFGLSRSILVSSVMVFSRLFVLGVCLVVVVARVFCVCG